MKPYRLEIEIQGLPKTANNQLRGDWRARCGEARKWKRLVGLAILQAGGPPSVPLSKVRISYTRFSSSEPDWDALVFANKHPQDGLVVHGVIIDDSMRVIGQPEYAWVKCKRGQGKIRIAVEEVILMVIGNFSLPEIITTTQNNGVVWNITTKRVEAWRNGALIGFSEKDVPNIEEWIEWMNMRTHTTSLAE